MVGLLRLDADVVMGWSQKNMLVLCRHNEVPVHCVGV